MTINEFKFDSELNTIFIDGYESITRTGNGIFSIGDAPHWNSFNDSTSMFSTNNLTIGSLGGLLKATAGVVSQASSGTDYEPPVTKGNLSESGSSIIIFGGSTTGNIIGSGTTIQIKKASALQDGYLGKDDFVAFSAGGHNPVTLAQSSITGGLSLSVQEISFRAADTNYDGYLKSSDWDTFNNKMTDPMSVRGDIVYRNSSNVTDRLAIGSDGYFLSSNGVDLVWAKSNVSYISQEFTNQTSVVVNHNLGEYPVVQVLDSNKEVVIPQSIINNSTNSLTVSFSTATSGTILITLGVGQNTGSGSSHNPVTLAQSSITGGLSLNDQELSFRAASTSLDGYLKHVDWNTFNSKQDAITTYDLSETSSGILTITGGTDSVLTNDVTIQVKKASASQDGYLGKDDFVTFSAGGHNPVTLTQSSVDGGLSLNNQEISFRAASTSLDGYLKHVDWNTFNSKEPAQTKGSISETASSVLTISNGTGSTVGPNVTIQVRKVSTSQDGYLGKAEYTTLVGLTSSSQGDLIYSSATNTWGKLTKSSTSNQYLKNSGTNNNPAWSSVNTTDLSTSVNGLIKGNGTGVVVATAGSDYAGIGSANTFTGVNKFENAAGVEIGKDDTANIAGVLKLFSAGSNSYYTTFTAGTQSANATYTLPTAPPAVTGYALTSTTAGVMSWATVITSPAGSSYQVQYNNAGAFGADSGFVWDNTNKQILIENSNAYSGIQITTAETTDKFPFISFRRYRNTIASPSAVQSGDTIALMSFVGRGATGNYTSAQFVTYADGNFTDSSSPGYIVLRTTPSGSTTPAERMRLTSAGNVFIGTTAGVSVIGTTWTHTLSVYGTDSGTQFNGIVSEGGACPARFNGYRHNGTYGTKTAVATTQNLLGINALGWDGGTTPTYVGAAAIGLAVDGAVVEDSVPGKIIFYTREVGNTGPDPYERMVITNVGKVGISNTAPSALLTIGTNATVGGAIDLLGLTSGTCAIRVASAAGTTTFQLPATNGTNGYYLQTNGSGVTSWATVAAAGSNQQVQFNSSGSFGASANFTFNAATLTLGGSAELAFLITECYGTGYTPSNLLRKANGTRAVPTAISSGDVLGVLNYQGYNGSGWGNSIYLQAIAEGNFTGSYQQSYLSIQTTIATTTAERMRITSAGGLLIGTTAGVSITGTTYTFQLMAAGTDSGSILSGISSESSAVAARFAGFRHNGSLASKSAVASGESLLAINGHGWDGGTTPTYINAAQILFAVDATVAEDNVPGRMVFNTRNAAGTLAERMRITNAGGVAIGVTALDANYLLQLPNSSSQKAKAYAWDTYACSEVWKTNIVPIPNSLNKINSLRGITFNYNYPEENHPMNGLEGIGITAEELDSLGLPNLVTKDNENYTSINLPGIIPILVEAIKELKTRIEILEQLNKQ